MKTKVTLDAVYAASNDIVAREIESKIIIIPFASGVDDTENEPYILNTSGKAIWKRLDGRRSLKEIVADLTAEFNISGGEIEKDVIGLVEELLKKRLLVEVSRA